MTRLQWTLIPALALFIATAPAMAATAHYDITSEQVAGRFTGLRIRLDLPAKPGSTHILNIPEDLRARLAPSGFAIDGGQWLDGKDADKLTFKASRTHVTVTYRLLSDGKTRAADDQHMRIHANGFAMRGDESLLTPENSQTEADVKLTALPGWPVLSSLNGPVPLSRLGDAFLIGGADQKILTKTVDGAEYSLIYPEALAVKAETIIGTAATIMTTERRFWKTPAKPVAIALISLRDGSNYSGRGFDSGFALYLGADVEDKSWLRLVAHEYLHNWISRGIGGFPATDDDLEAWLNEGFTEAYTARLLLASGLWTQADYIDDWNTSLARYGLSPVKAEPNSRILADRQRDFDVNKLPYDRGRLLAIRWDRDFKRRTQGRIGLSEVLRAQIAEAAHNTKSGHIVSADKLFPRVAKRLTGVDLSADLSTYVDKGEPITLDADIFGPCVRVSEVTQPVFDRGFDFDATFKAHGKLTGLEPDGPAARAGLKEGDKLRIDEVPSNDSRVPLSYRVEDGNGRSHTVTYLPEGKQMVSFQQLTLTKPDCPVELP